MPDLVETDGERETEGDDDDAERVQEDGFHRARLGQNRWERAERRPGAR